MPASSAGVTSEGSVPCWPAVRLTVSSRLDRLFERGENVVGERGVEVIRDPDLSLAAATGTTACRRLIAHELGHRRAALGDNDLLALGCALDQRRQLGLR